VTRAFTPEHAQLLPDTSAEEWRYSRVGQLDLLRYRPDDAVVEVLGAPAGAGSAGEPPVAGAAIGVAADAFVALNDEFGAGPVVIDVPAGTVLDTPVEIVHQLGENGTATFPRILIRAGEDSEFTVVERFGAMAGAGVNSAAGASRISDGAGSGPGPAGAPDSSCDALVVPVVELMIGRAARVRHVSVQDEPTTVTHVGRIAATVDASATLDLFHVALGGSYARTRFDCRLTGRGATGNLTALYLGDGDQMHDLRTFQDHEAPDTTSRLTFKGVVDGKAHAVYTGLIRIGDEGRGSNAEQSNRIIKLSPDAWAESVPNLEIHHNDVRCSHASTVGPIDPDQRFYLESRGVPPAEAERLVVAGFLRDVLAAIPVPAVVDEVSARIEAQLGGST
jgi:Fe-S cluster assembly protein SufD